MSLINDALKKAERLRAQTPATGTGPDVTPAAMPGATTSRGAGEPGLVRGARPAKRAAPQAFPTVARTVLLSGVLVMVLGIFSLYWLLRTPPPPLTTENPTLPTPTAPAVPSLATGSTTASSSTPPDPTPAATTGVLTADGLLPLASTPNQPVETTAINAPSGAAMPSSDPAVASSTHSAAVSLPAAAVIPGTAPAAAPPPAPRTDTRVSSFLDTLRVTGIRASGPDPRVLMNDRIFRLDDIVEPTLGVRLTGIAAARLTFTDERGATYTREF